MRSRSSVARSRERFEGNIGVPNPFTELPESARWSMLVGAVKNAIQEEGYRLDRLPGRGRSNVWRVEKDGKSQRASFRTTQDRWFAFPSLKGGAGWGTLDSVELVFIAVIAGVAPEAVKLDVKIEY
jgi:hypothetical protein